MKLWFGKKKEEKKTYDPDVKKPAVRASICTGEKVAGFVDVHTKHFEEVMLIRNQKDLDDFKRIYGIDGDIDTVY